MQPTLKVTQTKSLICQPEKLRLVMRGLGLRGIGSVKNHKDNNCIRGMVNKVRHLVNVEFVN